MPLLHVGVTFRRAPLDLLERIAIADDELPKAYLLLADDPDVREAVLLSTCNRIEVYAEVESYHAGSLALRRFLSADADVAPAELAEALDTGYEEQAVEHLFLVAAGLDSMVVGEPQSWGRCALRTAARRRGRGGAGDIRSVSCGRPHRPSCAVRSGSGSAPGGVHRGRPRGGGGTAGRAAPGTPAAVVGPAAWRGWRPARFGSAAPD